MTSYIICDIDGTLANSKARAEAYLSGDKDWVRFYAEAENDEVIEPMKMLLTSIRRDVCPRVYFVTGRPEKYYELTDDWLVENLDWVPFKLIMRKDGDHRPDHVIKQEHLKKLIEKHGCLPLVVFEDRQSCVDMYRANGCFVCQVAKGDY